MKEVMATMPLLWLNRQAFLATQHPLSRESTPILLPPPPPPPSPLLTPTTRLVMMMELPRKVSLSPSLVPRRPMAREFFPSL